MLTSIARDRLQVERASLRRRTKSAIVVCLGFVIGMTGLHVFRAAETSTTSRIAPTVPGESDYKALVERIRISRVLELSDPSFPKRLFGGARHGGELFISTATDDPLNPNTLDVYFDSWNLSARASLLLAYARLVSESDESQRFARLPEELRRTVVAYYADERARISQLVRAGGYETNWRPFVVAYSEFKKEAEQTIPGSAVADSESLAVYQAIGRLARSHGLCDLVRELRFDPTDVANEMLRRLGEARSQFGVSPAATDRSASLFYSCDSNAGSADQAAGSTPLSVANGEKQGVRLDVHVHTWHRLATALFRAVTVAEEKRYDPDALLIVTMFDGLRKQFDVWVAAHPDADSPTRDRALNQMANDRGLLSLLDHYGAKPPPSRFERAVGSSPNSPPGSKR